MPENILKKLNERILPLWKLCFFTALITGLIAHLYKITGWIPNWDSLVFRYDPQNMIALGRWFLPVVCSLSSFYDLPFLNGLIAIVFHALGAVCICKALNVEKKITAFLIGAVVATFPTVTSVMMYNYVADGYSIAFFLSVLAAMYMTGEKPKYILSSFLIALSAGIYQAYITVTIGLVVFKLIDEVNYSDISFKCILKKMLKMIFCGIAGVALYSIFLKASMSIFSVELIEYQGINSSVSLSNINLLGSLYKIKETFMGFFFDLSGGMSVFVVLNILIFLFVVYQYIKQIVIRKMYKSFVSMLLLVVLAFMLFVGTSVLAVANAEIDYHNLMLMGYVVFYLIFIVLYERGVEKNEKCNSMKCWGVFIIGLILTVNQIVISNVSYHKAQMAYEKSYGVLIRIADRIEETDEADKCDKILVIGALKDSEDYSVELPPDMTGITDGFIIRADDETVGQSVFCSAINDYCGKSYEFVSGDEKKKIAQSEEVKAMGVWPLKDCVEVIDNTIVIKLGAEGE